MKPQKVQLTEDEVNALENSLTKVMISIKEKNLPKEVLFKGTLDDGLGPGNKGQTYMVNNDITVMRVSMAEGYFFGNKIMIQGILTYEQGGKQYQSNLAFIYSSDKSIPNSPEMALSIPNKDNTAGTFQRLTPKEMHDMTEQYKKDYKDRSGDRADQYNADSARYRQGDMLKLYNSNKRE